MDGMQCLACSGGCAKAHHTCMLFYRVQLLCMLAHYAVTTFSLSIVSSFLVGDDVFHLLILTLFTLHGNVHPRCGGRG